MLPYSSIELNSREGFQLLWDFTQRNDLLGETPEAVIEQLIGVEEEIAAELLQDYHETLRDAMPNPWY